MSENNFNFQGNKAAAPETQADRAEPRGQRDASKPKEEPTRVASPFRTLSDGARLVGQRITENSGSDKFNALLKHVQDIIKESETSAKEFVILPMPKEVTRMHFSAIVLARRPEVPVVEGWTATAVTVAQVLLVEATGDNPRPYNDDAVRNRSFQVTPTAEDIYNDRFINAATKIISDALRNGTSVSLMDCVIVRRDFNVTDVNDVRRLISASTTGITTRAMQRHPDFNDWNLASWTDGVRDIQMPVSVESTTTEVQTTANGDVVHADMIVTVGIESRQRDRVPQYNDAVGNEPISETSVNIELVPVSPDTLDDADINRGRRRRRDRDFEPQAAWMPRANIVNIEQMQARTTAGILFAVASVAELNRDRQWASLFRPRRGASRKDINFYDIGALNIHANVTDEKGEYGPAIDTTDPEFGDEEFSVFLDRTLTQQMAIGIDCPDTGLQAFYTAPFAALATGDSRTAARAYDDLVASAMDLTNGAFEQFFVTGKDDIIEGPGERFHLGYWTDASGQRRDIRQLASFLPIANMVSANGTNMRLLDDWLDTWFGSQDENYRLAERLKILNAICDESLVITGMGIRPTLSGTFADALAKGIRETNVPMVPRNGDQNTVLQQRRVNSGYGSGALLRTTGVSRSMERRSTNSRSFRRNY